MRNHDLAMTIGLSIILLSVLARSVPAVYVGIAISVAGYAVYEFRFIREHARRSADK